MEKDLKEAKQKAINRRLEKISGTKKTDGIYTFKEIAGELEKYLPNTTVALKIVLAVALSGTRASRVPLWMLLVGSPSSGKTDLVRLLKGSKHTHYLDNLTLNAFISGERATEKAPVYDLLPELNQKCLILKDWTVIFSQDERQTKKILGDLVGIYDKSFSKHSSRRGNIVYEVEFSHVGCITPATLNKHGQYLNMIGPRFLHYIIPDLNKSDEDKSFEAIFTDKNKRKKQEKSLKEKVTRYLDQLQLSQVEDLKPLKPEVKKYLTIASRFVSRARGIVIMQATSFKDDDGKDVRYYELIDSQIEQPFRAVQQLLSLAEYLALVADKDEITDEELEIVKEVVISSMPADRAQAIRVLKDSEERTVTAKSLTDKSEFNKSIKTARRLLDELTYLGIVEKDLGSGQIKTEYSIKDEFKKFITVHPREFMSHNYRGTNNPDSTYNGKETKQYTLDEFPEVVRKKDTEGLKLWMKSGLKRFDRSILAKEIDTLNKRMEIIETELSKRTDEDLGSEDVETFKGVIDDNR